MLEESGLVEEGRQTVGNMFSLAHKGTSVRTGTVLVRAVGGNAV